MEFRDIVLQITFCFIALCSSFWVVFVVGWLVCFGVLNRDFWMYIYLELEVGEGYWKCRISRIKGTFKGQKSILFWISTTLFSGIFSFSLYKYPGQGIHHSTMYVRSSLGIFDHPKSTHVFLSLLPTTYVAFLIRQRTDSPMSFL